MKKTTILIAVLAVCAILFAVHGVAKAGVSEELKTDSIKFNKSNNLADCVITMEYPAERSTPLAKAVMGYIAETLGYENLNTLPQPSELLERVGEKTFNELCDMAREASEGGATDGFPYTDETHIKKIYESKNLVTFTTESYSYWGGAHGSMAFTPSTFTKDEGETLGFSIFKDTKSSKFKKVLKSGLKKYFEIKTDEELKEMLFLEGDIDDIPLPKTPPYFTKDGIVIVYAQYEIAPYAAGMPEITIPYDIAKALLTDEAAALIE